MQAVEYARALSFAAHVAGGRSGSTHRNAVVRLVALPRGAAAQPQRLVVDGLRRWPDDASLRQLAYRIAGGWVVRRIAGLRWHADVRWGAGNPGFVPPDRTGGPVLDGAGRLVGVVSEGAAERPGAYVPLARLRAVIGGRPADAEPAVATGVSNEDAHGAAMPVTLQCLIVPAH